MQLVPRNFDKFFSDFFAPMESTGLSSLSPRVDISDRGNHYEITAEMPGVKKEDIRITLNNGILSLEAESRNEHKEEKEGKLIRQERHYGKFVRSFNVGQAVQGSDITAKFSDGVLTLLAPKSEPEEPETKKIEIQ